MRNFIGARERSGGRKEEKGKEKEERERNKEKNEKKKQGKSCLPLRRIAEGEKSRSGRSVSLKGTFAPELRLGP